MALLWECLFIWLTPFCVEAWTSRNVDVFPAVYNIFAYIMFMVFIMVLPRMTDGFTSVTEEIPVSVVDLNNNMKRFYPYYRLDAFGRLVDGYREFG